MILRFSNFRAQDENVSPAKFAKNCVTTKKMAQKQPPNAATARLAGVLSLNTKHYISF